jgi:hypothetical protein
MSAAMMLLHRHQEGENYNKHTQESPYNGKSLVQSGKSIPSFIEYAEDDLECNSHDNSIVSQNTSSEVLLRGSNDLIDEDGKLKPPLEKSQNLSYEPLVPVYEDASDNKAYDPAMGIGEDSISSRSIEFEAKTGSSRSTRSSSGNAATLEGKRQSSFSSTSLTASMKTFSETESCGSLEEEDEDERDYTMLSPREAVGRLFSSDIDDDGSSCGGESSSNLSTDSPLSPFAGDDSDTHSQGEACCFSINDDSLASLSSETEISTFVVEGDKDDEFIFIANELLFVALSTIAEEEEEEEDILEDIDDDEEVEI